LSLSKGTRTAMNDDPEPGAFRARPSQEERRALLRSAVRTETRAGWRLQSRSDYRAVLVRRRTGSRGANLTLAVVTLGLWLPIWGVLVLMRDERELLITVDEWGFVLRTER
jgi:hypothetical protein